MDKFLSMISDIRVLFVVIAIVVILFIWLIVTQVNTKRLRNELNALEKKYTDIKNVPLSFKMNKAVAISRVDQETIDKVEKAKKDFEQVDENQKKLSESLAKAEDYVLVGKLKNAEGLMKELENQLGETHREVKALDFLLDDILAKETAQRQEVTSLKNRFRAIKSQANENASRLTFNWASIELKISDTEKMFTTFEDWMLSTDYEKANNELESIKTSLDELEKMIDTMPGLLEDARGVIPSLAETLHRDYNREKNRGVFVKHLEIEKNMAAITSTLKEDLKKLKNGKQDGVGEHLDDYKVRIQQLDEAVKKEGVAYDEMRSLLKDFESVSNSANDNCEYVAKLNDDSMERFGLGEFADTYTVCKDELVTLNEKNPVLVNKVKSYSDPASVVLVELKDLYEQYSSVDSKLSEIRSTLDSVAGDEIRARKQLVKLQVIMNQMQVKIRKYKLPNISSTYNQDIDKGNEYIEQLVKLMDEVPMNMQLINSLLQEALDFIYKLYNNVNNVVGTVVMVENTIVFGNRYRSTYSEVDNELSRSELLFRNGEYTKALTTAIATIEKIHPSDYETVIKENARSAA